MLSVVEVGNVNPLMPKRWNSPNEASNTNKPHVPAKSSAMPRRDREHRVCGTGRSRTRASSRGAVRQDACMSRSTACSML